MTDPYRNSSKPIFEYKIINHFYNEDDQWDSKVENNLNDLAKDGWRPILFSDAGEAATIILERLAKE